MDTATDVPAAVAASVKIAAQRPLMVLYLFAGVKRRSDMADALEQALLEKYALLPVEPPALHIEEIDTMRGGHAHNLLDDGVSTVFLENISKGHYDLVLVAPPCNTFSRAVFANSLGPKPVRDMCWPDGFPWLEPHSRRLADEGTRMVELALECLARAAETSSTRGLLEHPEDLGSAALGDPASIWQRPSAQALAARGYQRGAIYQCEWAPVGYSKPTGLLTNVPAILYDPDFHFGWPQFHPGYDRSGAWAHRCYAGPLPASCRHGGHPGLVRKPGEDGFRTTGTAAYHGDMCLRLARHFVADFAEKSTPAGGVSSPATATAASSATSSSSPPSATLASSATAATRRAPTATSATAATMRAPTATSSAAASSSAASRAARSSARSSSSSASAALVPLAITASAWDQQTAPSDSQIRAAADARRREVAFQATSEPGSDTEPDGEAEPAGSGWTGHGEPYSVGRGARRRHLVDGGGLCSPGRWPRAHRRLPEGLCAWLRGLVLSEIAKIDNDRPGGLLGLLGDLASGRVKSDPFPKESTEKMRNALRCELGKLGIETDARPGDRPQTINVRLLGGLLQAAGDPDWRVMDTYAKGVHIGVGVRMPRTPAVFPPKRKWRLSGQQDPFAYLEEDFGGGTCSNYTSAVGYADLVEKTLRDQAGRGLVTIMSEAQARREYGDRLTIASLGALEKGVGSDGVMEIRIIHDGTHKVPVNDKIRVRDGGIFPTAPDLKLALREQAATGRPHFGLTADIEEAHRMIAVDPVDWPLQACQARPGGEVFLNTCGTYGIASAAYWWGRLGAASLRTLIYILGNELPAWILLFADDWDFTAEGPRYVHTLLTGLWSLVIFKIPVKWKKCRGGLAYAWVGYEKSLREYALGISSRRAAWLEAWFSRVLDDKQVLVREMREALGRMSFVYGALEWDRPFLAPLFSFAALHPPGSCVQLPLFVIVVISWLRDRIRERRMQPCAIKRSKLGSIMRVDAKAEGNMVAIGGWRPTHDAGGKVSPHLSPWFAVELSQETAPWAFEKGLPYKTISSLELLATTLSLIVFGPSILPRDQVDATVAVTGFTDSQVSANVVVRGISTSYPLCCVAMELAVQLERRGARLDLEWCPRELNQEADDLSNLKVGAFRPELRLHVDPQKLPFIVLPQLMEAGSEFYKEVRAARAARKEGHSSVGGAPATHPSRRKGAPLKEREPW